MTIYIGNRQILRTPGSAITLTLESCDFAATEDNSIGYTKALNNQTNVTVDYNYFGTVIVNDGRFHHKKTFTWNLNLSSAKASVLKAMFEEQRYLIEQFQCNIASGGAGSFYIELIDGRIADIERDTFLRSYDTATTMTAGGAPTLPAPGSVVTGYSHRWFRYSILIQEIEGLNSSFMPLKDLSNIQMTAVELDLASTAAFPVTDIL